MSSKGRTELQISLSRAKNVEEAAGDIRFCVFAEKTGESAEKQFFSTKKLESFRKYPNASERIHMHPNVYECVQTGPNGSKQVRTRPKTSKNLRKLRKTCENFENKSETGYLYGRAI